MKLITENDVSKRTYGTTSILAGKQLARRRMAESHVTPCTMDAKKVYGVFG